jgi:hypothetical protein
VPLTDDDTNARGDDPDDCHVDDEQLDGGKHQDVRHVLEFVDVAGGQDVHQREGGQYRHNPENGAQECAQPAKKARRNLVLSVTGSEGVTGQVGSKQSRTMRTESRAAWERECKEDGRTNGRSLRT